MTMSTATSPSPSPSSLSTLSETTTTIPTTSTSRSSSTISDDISTKKHENISDETTATLPSKSAPTTIRYVMRDSAYITMMLHVTKYMTSVTGLLIGHGTNESEIEIDQVLPIQHSDTTHYTTTHMEMALLLAEQYLSTKKTSCSLSSTPSTSFSLVGIYFANGDVNDDQIPMPPVRVLDRLHERFGHGTVLLHLAADRMTPTTRRRVHCARVKAKLKSSQGTWNRAILPDHALAVSRRALDITSRLITTPINQQKKMSMMKEESNDQPEIDIEHPVKVHEVADFEDHCLDPRYDWLNAEVVKRLDAIPHPKSPPT